MQAITTKYIGPSNTKGARIKATCGGQSLTLGYRHDLSGSGVHAVAAMALARKLGFDKSPSWTWGEIDGGYVFVRSLTEQYAIEFA